MTRLVLVKHSTPVIVESIPAREWTLSAEGQARARQLADLLSHHRPEVIISSLEPKARVTAEILAETLGMDLQVATGLHEHDRTNAPYYSSDEFQNLVRAFFETPDVLLFGRETARQALTRFRTAVDKLLKTCPEETVVVVAHGTVISLFVAQLTGMDGFSLWRELGLPAFVTLDLQSGVLLEIVNLP